MPKFSISAHGAVLPDLTRRSLLVGTAAAATSPGMPPAAAACSAPSDCVIAILTQRLTAALTDYAVAERHRNDCERHYLDDGPMPPAALTRAGPLGSRLREWECSGVVCASGSGGQRMICAASLRMARGASIGPSPASCCISRAHMRWPT